MFKPVDSLWPDPSNGPEVGIDLFGVTPPRTSVRWCGIWADVGAPRLWVRQADRPDLMFDAVRALVAETAVPWARGRWVGR